MNIQKIIQSYKKQWSVWVGVYMIIAILFMAMIIRQQRGLNGEYYSNLNWESAPLISRVDRTPYLKGDTGRRLLGTSAYSVKWTGWITLPRSGTYRFVTQSDDGSALWINGQEVVNNGGTHGLQKRAGKITIKRGVYPIEVYYFQIGGDSFMKVSWKPPRSGEQPISDMVLFTTPPAWIERITNKLIWEVSEVLRTRQGIFLSSIFLLIVLDVLRWRGIAPSMGIKKIPGTSLMFLAILVSALPILYIISFGFTLHQVPNNDYWGSFNGIFSSGGMRGLFTKSNEHTVVIPHLFYYVNYLLTRGNNRGLFIWNILIVGGTLGFAINLLKQCSFLQKQEFYLAMPMCAIFLFAPSPADSWLLSMGGVMWFSANLFFFAALYSFMHYLQNSSLAMLVWSGCFALCSAFSYSSGIFTFLAIIAFLLLYVVFFKTGWTSLITWLSSHFYCCMWYFSKQDGQASSPMSSCSQSIAAGG
ncbi:hypothetical protein U27_00577 [Candidatus Vecturithrix granuli]|uniref:PA14 domain-containing protein n=1 Tax=Vecturithrix granuli TaxID=1499967 RepID=A0A081C7X4_VECG1|nr:hypothetical protein U27_00577 [Candidatus Vecturithrix granuli]